MSNLKLPDMSYENLSKLAPEHGWKKIAYQTWIRNALVGRGIIQVKHHDSIIATIHKIGYNEVHVDLDNHYYDSRTTSMRMDRILWDNHIRHERIAIREGLIRVLDGTTLKPIDKRLPASFHRPI